MADKKKMHHSRRKFLSLGFLTGAGMIAGKASAQSIPETGETVKMLTKDGKIVEVDKSVLTLSAEKRQATKKDVLRWIHPGK